MRGWGEPSMEETKLMQVKKAENLETWGGIGTFQTQVEFSLRFVFSWNRVALRHVVPYLQKVCAKNSCFLLMKGGSMSR